MRTTTQTFKQIMASGGARKYLVNIDLTLADTTVLHLTEADIWDNTFKIETASSGTSSFDIGSAVIGKCSFSINNFDERFNQYDFFNASAVVWVKLVGDTQYYRMGFYTVDEPVYASSLITLELLDNMWKFDIPLSAVTLSYPITIRNAFVAICQYCGVTLGTQTFHGDSFTIEAAPEKDMNCREFLQYMAMIGCNFLTISDTGALLVKWYNTSAIPSGTDIDGGTFDTNTTPYSDGANLNGGTFAFNDGDTADGGSFTDNSDCVWFTRNMQATFGTDVITITGVKFTINDTAYTIGTAGYMLELENPIVNANNVNTVLNLIWDVLNGFSLRTYNITTISDLSAEVGDCCILKDYKGNFFYSWITLNSFGFSNHVVQCNAVTPQRQLAKRYSKTVAAAVAESRIATEQFISDYDVAVQLMNDLAVNAMGAYQNYEDLQTGGRVYYLSNMPITKVGNTCSFQSGSTVFKKTGDGFYVSTNGGQTWQNGYNAQTGQLIVNVLNAIGISADWIKTGTLDADLITAGRIRDRYNYNYWDLDSGEFKLAVLPAGTGISDPDTPNQGAYVPTNSNLPASNWTTTELKKQHVGETFYNTSSKKTYIYKATTPPTLTPNWNSDSLSGTFTDRTVTEGAVFESAHQYSSGINEYYRFVCPSSWTTAYLVFDSQCETEGGNYDYLDFYKNVSGSITKQRVQGADFKSKVFAIDVSTEHAFWLHWVTDGSVVKWGWRFTTTADVTTYEWVEATLEEYIDVKAQSEAEPYNPTQQELYDILTNGDAAHQGIYLQNGTLLINLDYLMANTITVGGPNYNRNPMIEVRDTSGVLMNTLDKDGFKLYDINGYSVIGSLTRQGVVATAGTFGKLKIFSDSSNITYLKYVASGYRYYLNESWGAGKITNANRVVRCLINPYREGWETDAQIEVDFAMSVRNVASYKTATQCVLKLYKYTNGTRSTELTANIKYDGTGTNINNVEVYDEETGQWITTHWLDYTFDHNHGANPGDTYYITCTVEKRSATYTNNGGTTLSINDTGNGSGFVVREGSDHRAICSGRFLGDFTGDGTFDTVKVGDYILCGDGGFTTSTDNMGSYISYDGIRVWSGAADFGDSDNLMQIFHDDICKESGGTDYYAQFSSSDERVKEDIEDLDHELSKNLINGTRTREFTFVGSEGRHYGVIAQEARELLNNLGEEDSQLEYIAGRPDGKIPNQRNVNYNEYIPHLINYVKDLRSEIDLLKAEIKELKGE